MMKLSRMGCMLVLLFLVACSSKDDVVQEPESPIEYVATEDSTTPTTSENLTEDQLEKHNQELLTVLTNTINDYGLSDDIPTYDYEGLGILDVNVMDFDDNGKQELFLFFKSNKNVPSSVQTRYTENKVIEVWSTNNLGERELLYTSEIPESQTLCSTCEVYAAIVRQIDGTSAIYEYSGTADGLERTSYLTTINGNKAITHTLIIEKGNKYYHNDELITKEAYDTFFKGIDEAENILVHTEDGQQNFGHLYGKSALYTMSAIDQLTQYKYEVFHAYDQFSYDQLDTFTELATAYINGTKIDVQNDVLFSNMMALTLKQNLETIPKTREGEFYVISTTDALDRYRSMYFEMPTIDQFYLPAFDEEAYQTLSLKDNTIYFYYEPSEQIQEVAIIRTIQNVYEIEEGVYYIVVDDTEFDYSAYEKYYSEEAIAFENLPSNTYEWSERELAYAKTGITRFMLVRNADTAQYLYVDYVPLTLEKLQSYKFN